MPIITLSDWQSFLSDHPGAHILQTGEWGELKSTFGWDAVHLVAGKCGAQILFRRLPLGFTFGYIPKGPVFNGQCHAPNEIERSAGNMPRKAGSEQFWADVDATCHAHHAIFLKIELDEWECNDTSHPNAKSGDFALRTSQHNIQPRRTLVIDLRGGENDLLTRMKQKCRYNIRLAVKKGVTVRTWNDIDSFHHLMLTTGERDFFGVHSLEYYRRAYELFHSAGMAELLVAELEGKPLAALMVFKRGRRAWYFYGASSDEARNLMPTYLLQWEAIRWAKAHCCESYDLWGVPDEDELTLESIFESRQDGLWGVYRFKRGFGGRLQRAKVALDRVYNPLLYHLYVWRMGGRVGEPESSGKCNRGRRSLR